MPSIGITMSLDPGLRIRPGAAYLYVGRAYTRAVREAGGLPVLIPPDAEPRAAASVCDAFVMTGGGMLPTALGGAAPPDAVGAPELAERVAWDRRLLDAVLEARRPLLGVCYGMQLLNLHAGGTLHADLSARAASGRTGPPVDHGCEGGMTTHPIRTHAGTQLRELVGPQAEVSSSHRQCVDRVAAGFRAAAEASDGVVEAIEAAGGGAVLGVEWHPESDATRAAVYGWLLRGVEARA